MTNQTETQVDAGEIQDARPNVAGFSRRGLIGAAALGMAAGMATTAAHAQSFEDAKKGLGGLTDPGPKNAPLDALNKDSIMPPPTDHGSVPEFWHSFALSHRRVQQGGWARQVNVVDFPISKTIASVNMRLDAGGVRELHWHDAAEWSLMLTGTARLTAIDYDAALVVVGKVRLRAQRGVVPAQEQIAVGVPMRALPPRKFAQQTRYPMSPRRTWPVKTIVCCTASMDKRSVPERDTYKKFVLPAARKITEFLKGSGDRFQMA